MLCCRVLWSTVDIHSFMSIMLLMFLQKTFWCCSRFRSCCCLLPLLSLSLLLFSSSGCDKCQQTERKGTSSQSLFQTLFCQITKQKYQNIAIISFPHFRETSSDTPDTPEPKRDTPKHPLYSSLYTLDVKRLKRTAREHPDGPLSLLADRSVGSEREREKHTHTQIQRDGETASQRGRRQLI